MKNGGDAKDTELFGGYQNWSIAGNKRNQWQKDWEQTSWFTKKKTKTKQTFNWEGNKQEGTQSEGL